MLEGFRCNHCSYVHFAMRTTNFAFSGHFFFHYFATFCYDHICIEYIYALFAILYSIDTSMQFYVIIVKIRVYCHLTQARSLQRPYLSFYCFGVLLLSLQKKRENVLLHIHFSGCGLNDFGNSANWFLPILFCWYSQNLISVHKILVRNGKWNKLGMMKKRQP